VATNLGFAANLFAGTALRSLYCRFRRLREPSICSVKCLRRAPAGTWSTLHLVGIHPTA
jgi:hypothetical protein